MTGALTTGGDDLRLRWMVYCATVRHLGARGGLTDPGLEVVRRDLCPGGFWPPGSLPADLDADRAKLLDEVCEGLARHNRVPDFPPNEPAQNGESHG